MNALTGEWLTPENLPITVPVLQIPLKSLRSLASLTNTNSTSYSLTNPQPLLMLNPLIMPITYKSTTKSKSPTPVPISFSTSSTTKRFTISSDYMPILSLITHKQNIYNPKNNSQQDSLSVSPLTSPAINTPQSNSHSDSDSDSDIEVLHAPQSPTPH
eukprot:466701_1